jgi:integrative and conjugative element protein (TIGR02256 family)
MNVTNIKFTEEVAAKLLSYRQTGKKPEQGGILLGRLGTDGMVVVERITEPGVGDRFGRFFFDRCRKRAQKAVDRAWEESSGKLIYVGEWHTHPEAHPRPSGRDLTMIRNMRIESKMHIDFLVQVIIGLKSCWVGLETISGNRLLSASLETTPWGTSPSSSESTL